MTSNDDTKQSASAPNMQGKASAGPGQERKKGNSAARRKGAKKISPRNGELRRVDPRDFFI